MTKEEFCNGCVNAIGYDSSIELWHKRLRLENEKGLQVLTKREALLRVKGTSMPHKLGICYLARKKHQVSFYYITGKEIQMFWIVCIPIFVFL